MTEGFTGSRMTDYALRSYSASLAEEGSEGVSDASLRFWLASMMLSGVKATTATRYFQSLKRWIAEAYSEDPDVAGTFESFSVNSAIPNLGKIEGNPEEPEGNLAITSRLFAKSDKSAEWTFVQAFFYMLYGLTEKFSDLVDLTVDEAVTPVVQMDDIVEYSRRVKGRKYVFPLHQGKARPGQIASSLAAGIEKTLRGVGMRFASGFRADSIHAIWIAAALKSGVSISEIRGAIGRVPYEYAPLTLIEGTQLGEGGKMLLQEQVADLINDTAQRWFVMKLRSGVKVADVMERIDKEFDHRYSGMQTYYPMRVTYVRKEKRLQKESAPVLPDLLFFKTQKSKVRHLFARIGDLAWCFKLTNSADSDYSVISNAEMRAFQACVGQFTPDMEVETVSDPGRLGVGRKVRITDGVMKGFEGEIIDIKNRDNDPEDPNQNYKRMVIIRFSSAQALVWKVEIEEAFIQPL